MGHHLHMTTQQIQTVEYYLEGSSPDAISALSLRTEAARASGADGSEREGIYVHVPVDREAEIVDRLRSLAGVEPFFSEGL
jgi:hypothetical protein